MKAILKSVLAGIVIMTGVTAFAADVELVLVPNNHGQFTPMYRSVDEPTIALNISGQGVGNNIVVSRPNPELTVTRRYTGHGQAIVEYWRNE